MKVNAAWGFVLLAIWLIVQGIVQIISGSAINIVLGLLALAAGLMILMSNLRAVR
jgi:uncharacterized membrane protein HdeD (DUF308 family)